MATRIQGSHFFDRVPASESTSSPIASVYVFLNPGTGRYVLSDSLIPGWTRVFFKDGVSPRVHLDDDGTGARTAALFGSSTVQL